MNRTLKILVLLLSLTFAGTAYARTPVVDLNKQDDEIDKLQDQIEKYENITDDNNATITSLKAQISQKNATIAAWQKVLRSSNPSIAIISPAAGKKINSRDTLEVKWRGTNLSGSSIDFYLSKKAELSSSTTDTIFVSNSVNSGSATITLPSNLTDGSYFLTLVAKDLTFNGQPVQRTLKKPLKVSDKTTRSIRVTSMASTSVMVQQGGKLNVAFDTTNIANGVDLGVYLTSTNVNDMAGATLLATVNAIQGVKELKVTIPASSTLGVHKIAVATKDASSTVGYSIQGVVVTAKPAAATSTRSNASTNTNSNYNSNSQGTSTSSSGGLNTSATDSVNNARSMTINSPSTSTSVKAGSANALLVKGTVVKIPDSAKVKIYLKGAGSEKLIKEGFIRYCASPTASCVGIKSSIGLRATVPKDTTAGTYTLNVVAIMADGLTISDESDPFTVTK
jgi:hypothetical protein